MPHGMNHSPLGEISEGYYKQSTSVSKEGFIYAGAERREDDSNTSHQTKTWIRILAGTERLVLMESVTAATFFSVSTGTSLTSEILVSVSPLTVLSYTVCENSCSTKPPCPVNSLDLTSSPKRSKRSQSDFSVLASFSWLNRDVYNKKIMQIQKIELSINYRVKVLARSENDWAQPCFGSQSYGPGKGIAVCCPFSRDGSSGFWNILNSLFSLNKLTLIEYWIIAKPKIEDSFIQQIIHGNCLWCTNSV